MNAVLKTQKVYGELGVDVEAAMKRLESVPVSLHCWQGDDVTGFDHDGPLTGGIQTTGNYPARHAIPKSCSPIWKRLCLSAPARRS